MSERFERSIRDWYQNSRTTDLEFLNLENPNLSDISNNITVLYDKLLLHSKICIKHYHQAQEQFAKQNESVAERLHKIEQTQIAILQSVQILETEVLTRRTVSKEDLLQLIDETTNQPKERKEQEVLQIASRLEDQQKQLLSLVSELKQAVIG